MTRFTTITHERGFIRDFMALRHNQPAPLVTIRVVKKAWCERCDAKQPYDVADGDRFCGRCGQRLEGGYR